MSVKRRILVSAPRDIRLDPHRIEIKRAIVDEIKRLGYEPQIFLGPKGGVGLPDGAGWDLEGVEKVARRCVGAAIIGLPFWKTTQEGQEIWLPTDYCQYEGAVAHVYGLPILAIAVGIEVYPAWCSDNITPVEQDFQGIGTCKTGTKLAGHGRLYR